MLRLGRSHFAAAKPVGLTQALGGNVSTSEVHPSKDEHARSTRPLFITLGVVLLGGFVALIFLSSAFFYWATRPNLTDSGRLTLFFAPFIIGLAHALVVGFLVWRSSTHVAPGLRSGARFAAVLYLALQLSLILIFLVTGSGTA